VRDLHLYTHSIEHTNKTKTNKQNRTEQTKNKNKAKQSKQSKQSKTKTNQPTNKQCNLEFETTHVLLGE